MWHDLHAHDNELVTIYDYIHFKGVAFTEVRQITPKFPLTIIYISVLTKLSVHNALYTCLNVFCE